MRLDEKEPFVVIGPDIVKKRRIRNVTIPQNAVAWLQGWGAWAKGHPFLLGLVSGFQKRFRRLQQKAGFRTKDEVGAWQSSWEGNAMRHSFGSYHYAMHGNSIETARLLGHKADDTVLFAHYRALATKAQGEAYFDHSSAQCRQSDRVPGKRLNRTMKSKSGSGMFRMWRDEDFRRFAEYKGKKGGVRSHKLAAALRIQVFRFP